MDDLDIATYLTSIKNSMQAIIDTYSSRFDDNGNLLYPEEALDVYEQFYADVVSLSKRCKNISNIIAQESGCIGSH